jgi:hypothetical protein
MKMSSNGRRHGIVPSVEQRDWPAGLYHRYLELEGTFKRLHTTAAPRKTPTANGQRRKFKGASSHA